MAGHFRRGGAYDEAAVYYEQSGDRAALVSACSEAICESSKALEMLEKLPTSTKRLRREVTLNRRIASQWIAMRGIPTKDVHPYYTKCRDFSERLGDTDEIINAAWGLWSIQLMGAQMDACLKTATDVLPSIEALDTPVSNIIGAYMLGVTHAYRGTLDQACHSLEDSLSQYSLTIKDDLKLRFGMDIGLTANSFLGWVYALRRQDDKADQSV